MNSLLGGNAEILLLDSYFSFLHSLFICYVLMGEILSIVYGLHNVLHILSFTLLCYLGFFVNLLIHSSALFILNPSFSLYFPSQWLWQLEHSCELFQVSHSWNLPFCLQWENETDLALNMVIPVLSSWSRGMGFLFERGDETLSLVSVPFL